MARLCAVSVDLDEVPHYLRIHGLAAAPARAPSDHLVYDVGLPRIESFARAHDLPLALFAVGADLGRGENAAALCRLAGRGHAIENHSLDHRYDLARLGRDEIARQVGEGARAIERATGGRPVGFRAPGYTVSDTVFDVLEELGVAFDSSVFPCPAYYAAKAATMGLMRLRGRRSASVLDTPRVLAAPTRPYRPGAAWYRRGARAFVELPVQVTPGLRLPVIGTSIAVAGASGARLLAARCAREPFVNLELHGIDFLDAADGLAQLARHQAELRIPLARRLDALSAAVRELRSRGFGFVRLDEAARSFSGSM